MRILKIVWFCLVVRGYPVFMERVLWSGMLVLVWVASVTMLTWGEFVVAALVLIPCAYVVVWTRRALSTRRFEGGMPGNRQ